MRSYMFMLILSVFIILVALGIVMVCSKKGKVIGRILISVAIILAAGFGVLIASIIIALSTPHAELYCTMLLIAAILIVLIPITALFGVLKKKFVWIPIVSGLLICAVVTSGYYNYQNAPTIVESDDLLNEYKPYVRNTKAISLEENSTLKIESEIPKLDGATALYPIYSAFAKAVYPRAVLLDEAPGVDYNNEYLQCSTTTGAYSKIVTGEADMIFAAAPSEQQIQFAAENGVELVYTPIGKEAFVFFVNARNKLDDITVEQVQKIYSGEITKWNELGVRGFGDIQAFQREEGSGSQSALIKLMGDIPLMEPPKDDVIMAMGGIISQTADYKNHRNAIGYSFRFYSTEMVKNKQIKLLSINGIEPTIENIENGTYPIASYFYAVTRSDADENTKKLLEWILSEQGQEIIERTGYTPLK